MDRVAYEKIVIEFLQKTHCDRCHKLLGKSKIMSIFNTDRICEKCWEDEKKSPQYSQAVTADNKAIERGEWDWEGFEKGKN